MNEYFLIKTAINDSTLRSRVENALLYTGMDNVCIDTNNTSHPQIRPVSYNMYIFDKEDLDIDPYEFCQMHTHGEFPPLFVFFGDNYKFHKTVNAMEIPRKDIFVNIIQLFINFYLTHQKRVENQLHQQKAG